MLGYLFTRIFIESFRLVPFRVLYLMSDITWFILFKIIGYRKKVLFENLNKAFPEKSKEERAKIAYKFYRSFTDLLLEGLKSNTMSRKSMLKRYKLLNPELLDKYFENGQSVICLGAHYCNWEWAASLQLHMRHESVAVYKMMSNQRINTYIREKRIRWGMKQISMEKTRVIFKTESKPKFILLVADQNPSSLDKAFWVNFMGIDTPCIHGPEIYANMFNYPVLYVDFQRQKRGFITAELSLLCENPKSLEKSELTEKYMAKLEEILRKKPEDWLWTHKRWKHKREGDKILTDYYYK